MRNGKYIDNNGTEYWRKGGKLHRDDGPAEVRADGTELWYQDGKAHRDNGPAITYKHGDEFWYQNDKLHREDGPAVTYEDGAERWFKNGVQLTESQILILKEKNGFNKMMKDMFTN